ncbi:hypothetical protein HNQ37_001710 [Lactovum miscens]|uniref:Uncharacterized protein n=1 Tax=Lactovum miscens TaxID=190387 RepID=A0A841C905_9LACT|nr:hypothetical protein [Lactovum miscens]
MMSKNIKSSDISLAGYNEEDVGLEIVKIKRIFFEA